MKEDKVDIEGDGKLALDQFARELGHLRTQTGMSRTEIGRLANCSASWLKAIELGHRQPTVQLGISLDGIFHTQGGFEKLARAIEAANTPQWFGKWAALEDRAVQLWSFEPLLVPGLFQTRAYAYAVLSEEPDLTAEQVDDLIAARAERQGVLSRPRPP